ncbi:YhcH/YjgK/YiaL family protein [Candidatus Pantoea persica]|uniref:YhcH/YjgK/YiaL family protein n=1 Tax=Candidatus Pantoea persica TaxID=2518128 RepID=UPI00215D5E17|nr:YhcH/YjgK/YiaL family protein [Candidatus Pantoea persica]MBA2815895.1 hypothetical protein [Candidatus Pantoea persica]
MIIGTMQSLTGLPEPLRAILTRADCSLTALQQREDGRFQPGGAAWFCHIGPAQTEPSAQCHTEYHRQWADIQLVLAGEKIINASPRSLGRCAKRCLKFSDRCWRRKWRMQLSAELAPALAKRLSSSC